MYFVVTDPPKFKPPPSSTAVGVESESLVVTLVAEGNPAAIQYTWTKDGLPIAPKNGKFLITPTDKYQHLSRCHPCTVYGTPWPLSKSSYSKISRRHQQSLKLLLILNFLFETWMISLISVLFYYYRSPIYLPRTYQLKQCLSIIHEWMSCIDWSLKIILFNKWKKWKQPTATMIFSKCTYLDNLGHCTVDTVFNSMSDDFNFSNENVPWISVISIQIFLHITDVLYLSFNISTGFLSVHGTAQHTLSILYTF